MFLYVLIGSIGLIFLLASIFAGDAFSGESEVASLADVSSSQGAGAPGIAAPRVLAASLLAFGVGGIVARYSGNSHLVSAGTGLLTGIVVAITTYSIARLLRSRQAPRRS
jgi:hypothetical protein